MGSSILPLCVRLSDVSDQAKPIRYVSLLYLRGRRSQADTIQADRFDVQNGILRLYREDRVVWRGPRNELYDVVGHAHQRSSHERCKVHREYLAGAGAATIHLQEGGVAPRVHRDQPRGGRTAIPAEGIRVVLEDSAVKNES